MGINVVIIVLVNLLLGGMISHDSMGLFLFLESLLGSFIAFPTIIILRLNLLSEVSLVRVLLLFEVITSLTETTSGLRGLLVLLMGIRLDCPHFVGVSEI